MARDLLDSESSDYEDGGTQLQNGSLKVNTEYARRFEHNKKREELQRLEEKIGQPTRKRKRTEDGEDLSESEDESTSESEDEGELATEELDTEILATLNAIRSKDPRVYNKTSTFYTPVEESNEDPTRTKKDKPMHLQDYHRANLLNGVDESSSFIAPRTYNEEQEELKRSILGEIAAAADRNDNEASDEEGDNIDLLTTKERPRSKPPTSVLDVENADKDPETFLSNFMSSRAWASSTSNLHPFESDDEEEERHADEFEEAYNFRFEDPQKSNEKLTSHARDLAAKYSVRREDTNPRRRRRDVEKEEKAAAQQQLREEKARLKKLRMEQVEEKIRKIRRAGGIGNDTIEAQDWSRFVDDDWDDQKWEDEMKRRFGEAYYAQEDLDSEAEQYENKRRKIRKPKFDDDIDIKDIVPDFEDDERPDFSLSDEELQRADVQQPVKDQKRKIAKKQRILVEQLVEDHLQMEINGGVSNISKKAGFRYRETSPKSFGLTAQDILLAEDSQLNQFAGLKKLAAFRDAEKKRKDSKHLGKRARLRKWRQDTFGNEDGPAKSEIPDNGRQHHTADSDEDIGGVEIKTEGINKRKRRRQKKSKSAKT